MTKHLMGGIFIAGAMVSFLAIFYLKPETVPDMSYAEFQNAVNNGHIDQVVIDGQELSGIKSNGERFTTFNPGDPDLIDDLVENHVAFKGERPEKFTLWFTLISRVLMFALLIYFMRRMLGPLMGFGKSKLKRIADEKISVTFSDVAGCDEAKEDVFEMVEFLKDPGKFQRLGGQIPRGVLMMGPPGTGKTLLARAIAGEAKVPFFSISGSDFVEMYVGLGAARVRNLFESAKKKAPCIIFIDEIDAVGRHRGNAQGDGHQEREQTLNQLLVEMDGFSGNEGIIIIAATNRPDVLDKALLRPGRFDRHIAVGLPDVRGRQQILAVHMKKIPVSSSVDPEWLARGTPEFSGADLAHLVNEAALFAARKDKLQVDMKDFERAKDKILMGAERNASLMSEEEKRMTAYHEAGHALVGLLVPEHNPIYKVSIIPRGQSMGVTMFLPERDQFSSSREKLESEISSLYGGRLAEEIVFGPQKVTTGAQNDIERATLLATNMVTRWGFSERVGALAYAEASSVELPGSSISKIKPLSEGTAQLIDEEIRALLGRNYERAERLIRENLDKLHLMAEALMTQETLDRSQIHQIMEGRTAFPLAG